jgi:hypothetical protein
MREGNQFTSHEVIDNGSGMTKTGCKFVFLSLLLLLFSQTFLVAGKPIACNYHPDDGLSVLQATMLDPVTFSHAHPVLTSCLVAHTFQQIHRWSSMSQDIIVGMGQKDFYVG